MAGHSRFYRVRAAGQACRRRQNVRVTWEGTTRAGLHDQDVVRHLESPRRTSPAPTTSSTAASSRPPSQTKSVQGVQVFPKFPGPRARPLAVVSFDDGLGQRQVNKASSSRPKASDPQFAQPCAFANVPETTREHWHPLLIPRSLVRAQHGPLEFPGKRVFFDLRRSLARLRGSTSGQSSPIEGGTNAAAASIHPRI